MKIWLKELLIVMVSLHIMPYICVVFLVHRNPVARFLCMSEWKCHKPQCCRVIILTIILV